MRAPQDCSPNCGFSNPSSPYGLTLLPLSPGEVRRAKAKAGSTPDGLVSACAPSARCRALYCTVRTVQQRHAQYMHCRTGCLHDAVDEDAAVGAPRQFACCERSPSAHTLAQLPHPTHFPTPRIIP